jgi:hypothetical protein
MRRLVWHNINVISTPMSLFGPRPEDEADVDREIRIEKIERELEDLSGGSMTSGNFGETSPSLEEAFLTLACEYENASYDTNFNRLVQRGTKIVPPAELDDTSLHAKLQEVRCALAKIRCSVENTDHLTDRELYTWLWSEGLREETPDLSQLGGAWHMSPIGSGNEEDTAIFLKYYASKKGTASLARGISERCFAASLSVAL